MGAPAHTEAAINQILRSVCQAQVAGRCRGANADHLQSRAPRDSWLSSQSSEIEANYIIEERSGSWRRALIANARAKRRPIARLALSAEKRSYLERQVRRRRVARSWSERCRMILRRADGCPSKSVAVEIGVHEHPVGKWRHRFLRNL